MSKSKFIKLALLFLIGFFYLSLFVVVSPTAAQDDVDKGLLWNKVECQKKCGLIGQEMVKKLKSDKKKCEEKSDKDCSYFDQTIKSIESPIHFGAGIKNEKNPTSDYCINLGEPSGQAAVYCYAPPAVVSLQIPIGETKVAYGLVHYIDAIFRWGTKTIAVVAVLIIMFSGIQWLTAAGSQNAISQAKKRITNAVAGLILVLLSIAILNFINPALTNLSGFNIKMVPTISQSTIWCKDIESNEAIELIVSDNTLMPTKYRDQEDYKKETTIGYKIKKEINQKEEVGFCGIEYEDNNGNSCTGDFCPKADNQEERCFFGEKYAFECSKRSLFGTIVSGKIAEKAKQIKIWLVATKVKESEVKFYRFGYRDLAWDACAYDNFFSSRSKGHAYNGMLSDKGRSYSFGDIKNIYSITTKHLLEKCKNEGWGILGYLLEIKNGGWRAVKISDKGESPWKGTAVAENTEELIGSWNEKGAKEDNYLIPEIKETGQQIDISL